MDFETLIPWGIGAAVVVLLSAVVLLLLRLGSLRTDMSSLRTDMSGVAASHQVIHRTVKERLDEVSQHVGDGLLRSDKTLGEVRERLAVIDEAQKRLTELSTQVVSLQDVLSNKQARGAFGEVQLKDIVEAALPPSAYAFQHTLTNRARPDCLIRLPNPPGPIAVDAKFPLESYRMLREARNEAETVTARRQFSRDMSQHTAAISDKYILPGETAESALLFLPSEAVYAELHANFTSTVEESYRRRVWIVSPTTLMATLNTVRAILRDVMIREQAELVRHEIGRLLDDVRRLGERTQNLARHFGQAEQDLREIGISSDKIVRRGERIREVDLSAADDPGRVADEREPELPVGIGRIPS